MVDRRVALLVRELGAATVLRQVAAELRRDCVEREFKPKPWAMVVSELSDGDGPIESVAADLEEAQEMIELRAALPEESVIVHAHVTPAAADDVKAGDWIHHETEECTWSEFWTDNYGDLETLESVARLGVKESCVIGGGASPAYQITRAS